MSKNTDLANIGGRNFVTVTGSGNATASLADFGKTFFMDLATYGILTLPDPTTQSVGWYIDVYIASAPASYQGAYITHSGTLGSKFVYRKNATNTFILIGLGEGFRITFYNNVYNVNCIMQPQTAVSATRTYTGSGTYNTTATGWVEAVLNTFSGGTGYSTIFSNSNSSRIIVGAAGVYQVTTMATLYAQGGPSNGGFGIQLNGTLINYQMATLASGEARTPQTTIPMNLSPGDGVASTYYTNSSATWYYPDNDYVKVELLQR